MQTTLISPAELIESARRLRPQIESHIEQIDRERKVGPEIIDAMSAAGIFRMLVPAEFGGGEVDLDVAADVITEIARGDASVGWQVMVGAGNQYFLGKLPESSMRHTMDIEGGALVRGALAPKGISRPVDGGFLLTGRWPLASGSYQPHWVPAGFMVMDDNGPRRLENGAPDMRIAILRPEQITWHDTWDSVGLRGSQSQDFEVTDVFVPEEMTGSFFGTSSIDSPWYKLPPMPTGPLHAAVIVGALRGLIDDVSALAPTKKPSFGPGTTLAEDPVFTTSFGELVARVDILAAANRHVASSFMALGRAGGDPDPLEYQQLLAMNTRIQREAPSIADEFVSLAGSTALYSSNTMQRRWRDIRAAAQHVSASLSSYTNLGTSLSGGKTGPN